MIVFKNKPIKLNRKFLFLLYKNIYTKNKLLSLINKQKNYKRSYYSKWRFELKKIKQFYILNKKDINTIISKKISIIKVISLLENRIDITLFRTGFFKSLKHVRNYISSEKIYVNKILIKYNKFILFVGDIIEIKNISILNNNTLINKYNLIFTKYNFSNQIKYNEDNSFIILRNATFLDSMLYFSINFLHY